MSLTEIPPNEWRDMIITQKNNWVIETTPRPNNWRVVVAWGDRNGERGRKTGLTLSASDALMDIIYCILKEEGK